MIQQEKYGEKSLNDGIMPVLTNANFLYKALSSSPNNKYQSHLCLENPIKKLLKATLL
ncbi:MULTISPECIES: hypothetical protein [unclassified Bartonella]|uniref:hypothetical protein n=1 Tax=unclassified Bartonella TaxID=2645622 RepID=UPI0035D0F46A